MPTDVLAQLVSLPGVAVAAAEARDRVDALLWDRTLRPVAVELARQSALRGAWANAAIDGAEVPLDSVLGDAVEVSPMGERVGRTVAMTTELPRLVEVYRTAPLQVWAQLHSILHGGLAPAEEIGRPRSGPEVEDPLRLGPAPTAQEVSDRLSALAMVLASPTAAPAVVVAGVVHAELAVLRPFRQGSGSVARATIRLQLAAAGLDPDCLSIPEAGLLSLGRAKYVRALQAYAAGTEAGLASWLTWFSGAVTVGAEQAAGVGAGLTA